MVLVASTALVYVTHTIISLPTVRFTVTQQSLVQAMEHVMAMATVSVMPIIILQAVVSIVPIQQHVLDMVTVTEMVTVYVINSTILRVDFIAFSITTQTILMETMWRLSICLMKSI